MDSSRTANRLQDILDIVASVSNTELWWRGQSKAVSDWKLVPRVYRPTADLNYEQNITLRFMQRAPSRYVGCPPRDELPSWLFLMQHYRLPTRLLDWTASPLIAAYFAVSEHPSEAGALWALNPVKLNEKQATSSTVLTPGDISARPLFYPPFRAGADDRYYKESSPGHQIALAIMPNEVDLRMQVQLAAFTLHGATTPLEEIEGGKEFMLKFEIPANAKAVIEKQLFQLGIRESSIFPDLEHLAKEIASKPFLGS